MFPMPREQKAHSQLDKENKSIYEDTVMLELKVFV